MNAKTARQREALVARVAKAESRYSIARGAAASKGARIETASVSRARRSAEDARQALRTFDSLNAASSSPLRTTPEES